MILNNAQNTTFSTSNAQQQPSHKLNFSLSDWIRFKRSDCPVCQGAKKDCRQNQKTTLIHCRDISANPIDYVFRGQDTLGFGMWAYKADAQQWSQEQREQWQRERLANQSKRLAHHAKTALPVETIDLAIRKLARYLGLTSEHRQQLRDRGLTDEQVDAGLFFSITENQEIPPGIPPNFPGVDWSGKKLFTSSPGIACPAFNSDGKAIGYQIRLNTADSGKYRWPKGQVSSHLQNGELPLTITGPSLTDAEVIWLTEGILKPFVASQKWGIPCIGAAGGNHQGSPQQLLAALQQIPENCLIAIAPDAGAILNQNVLKQYEKTVKLLTEWGYGDRIQFVWWGQATKLDNDCDEITQDEFDQIQYLNSDEFDALCPNSPVNRFKDWLDKQIKHIKPKGFGVPKIEGETFEGDRALVWEQLIAQGYDVLDKSFMGSGKSHDVPNLVNSNGKIWYLFNDHRNPTVKGITQGFVDLFPRNQYGFYRNKKGKLVKADQFTPKEQIEIEKNCIRADLFPKLTKLGYDPDGTESENPICASCPMFNTCQNVKGWYRHDRRETLKSPKIRCHPQSMPRDYDYSNDLFNLDEVSQLIKPTKTIETYWDKLLVEADRYRETLDDKQWESLDTVLQSLKVLFNNGEKWGLEHYAILKTIGDCNLTQLIESLETNPLDLAKLFPLADTLDLTQAERQKHNGACKTAIAHFRNEAYKESQVNLENLPPNALIHLLKAINGEKGIVLRIKGKTLSITLDNRSELGDILSRGKGRIYLDGTLDCDRLVSLVGENQPLQVIRSKGDKPTQNLKINQIKVKGIGSKDYSEIAIHRINVIRETLGEMPMIAHKALQDRLNQDGHWFNHNRGSNDFAGQPKLMAIGLPMPNVGAIQDEFLAINGHLDGFEEYYARLVNDEILQLIGRQRVNRYPDQEFNLYFLTPEHTDLSWLEAYGAKVTVKTGFEIHPEAGTETQCTRHKLIETILQFRENGIKTTQAAIAQVIEQTQQSVSKTLQQAGISLRKLVKLIDEKITTSPYKDSVRSSCINDWLYSDLTWFFDLPLDAIAEEIIKVIQDGGLAKLKEYLEDYPNFAQAKVLGLLWGLLDTEPTFVSEQLKT